MTISIRGDLPNVATTHNRPLGSSHTAIMAMQPAPVVWINGWQGVGKSSVAAWLSQLLGEDKALLVENHQDTEQAAASTPSGMKRRQDSLSCSSDDFDVGTSNWAATPAQPARQEQPPLVDSKDQAPIGYHKATLATIEDEATLSKVIILTHCATASTADATAASARAYAEAARHRGRKFLPVYLDCHVDENARRVETLERRSSLRRGMIRSGDEARRARGSGGLLFAFADLPGLSLNITRMEPHEAAMEVLSFVRGEMDRGDGVVASPARE